MAKKTRSIIDLELVGGKRDLALELGLGHLGIVVLGQAEDLEMAFAGRDLHRQILVVLEGHLLAVGQGLDDLEDLLAGDRDRPRLLDLGREFRPETDLEVRAGHLDLPVLGLDQDIGQDRHGVPLLHDALEKLKFIQNVLFDD